MKRKLRLLSFVLSAVMLIVMMPLDVQAVDPDYVVRAGGELDFVVNLPYKDITAYVRTDDIKTAAKDGHYKFVPQSEKLVYNPNYDKTNLFDQQMDYSLFWNEVVTRTAAETTKEVDFGGYKITYKNVVRLLNGSRANLTIEATEIKGYLTGPIPENYIPKLSYDKTNKSAVPILTSIYAESAGNLQMSLGYNMKISVTTDENGNQPLENCVLPLMAVDIDNPGVPDDKVGGEENIEKRFNNAKYLESIQLNSSNLKSKIYIPSNPNNVLNIDDYKLTATAYDEYTSKTGFATLIDGGGTTFRWEGTGCGTLLEFPDSKYLHEVTAEVNGTYLEGGVVTTKTNEKEVSTDNTDNTHKSALLVPQTKDVTITIKAKDTYEIENVEYDGVTKPLTDLTNNGDGSYSIIINAINASHDVKASFKRASATVTYQSEEVTKGTIGGTPSETVTFEESPVGSGTAEPASGYRFKEWRIDKEVTLTDDTVISAGGVITDDQIKEIKVTENITITAYFELDPFTVTYVTDGHGTVDKPSEQVNLNEKPIGASATASTDYYFKNWKANRDVELDNGGNPTILISAGGIIETDQIAKIIVTEDITLTAYFAMKPVVFYDTDGDGTENETESVTPGLKPSGATPIPSSDHDFSHWTADKDVKIPGSNPDGSEDRIINAGDPITDDELKSIVVSEDTGDIKITAVFEPIPVVTPPPAPTPAPTPAPVVVEPKPVVVPKTEDRFNPVVGIICMMVGFAGFHVTTNRLTKRKKKQMREL